MNPQTYAQMLEMQQQQGAPMVSQGAPQPQGAPMVPRYDSNNPLGEGSMKAVHAARQGLQAKKPGILSNLMRVAHTFAVNNARANPNPMGSAMGHAFKTPDEVDARNYEIEQQNHKMMQFLQAQEAAKQKQAFQQQKMMQEDAYRQQNLGERMRHNKALEGHYGASNRMTAGKYAQEQKALMDTEMLQQHIPDAVPFSAMTPSERALAAKRLNARINAPKHSGEIVKIFDELENIVEDYPDLAGSFPTLLAEKPVAERIFMSKGERTALNKFKALTNQLVLANVVKGAGNARMTVFLENVMSKGKPNINMTPDGIRYLASQSRETHKETRGDSKIARKANSGMKGIGRYDVPEYYEEYNEPESGGKKSGNSVQGSGLQDMGNSSYSNSSNEDLDASERHIMESLKKLK